MSRVYRNVAQTGGLVGLAVVLTLTIGPFAAELQQTGRIYRIGFLSLEAAPLVPPSLFEGLRDHGYVEGRDFVIEFRSAAGRSERLPVVAAELLRTRVDVIVTRGTAATLAAKEATRVVPIVFGSAAAPVEKGIVASLARPGSNVTGIALHIDPVKPLELLKEIVPRATNVAHLTDPNTFGSRSFLEASLQRFRSQASVLGVRLQSVPLSGDPDGVLHAFAEFRRDTNGLVLDNAGLLIPRRELICGLALEHRLPAVGRGRLYSEAGCVASYGEDVRAMYRRAAYFIDRILKGTKPGDLPVEQPTKFELVINLKTAKALGLTIPQSVLLRADQVIE